MSLSDWEVELLSFNDVEPEKIHRETSMYELMQLNVQDRQQRIAEAINDGIIKQRVFDEFRAEVRDVLLNSGYVPQILTGRPAE